MRSGKRRKVLACLTAALLLVSMVSVSAAAEEDTVEENTLTNSIESSTRTVAQDGSTLSYENVDGVDTYTVSDKEGLTVTYENSMNMTVLAASFLGKIQESQYAQSLGITSSSNAWTVLQTFYAWITDSTVIYLTYQFNSAVDLSELTSDDLSALAAQITLSSDMFTFSQTAEDLSVNAESNALVITCHWSSTNAASAMTSKNKLDPEITITGITLDLVSDWGTTTAEDGTVTENDTLTVTADGAVTGTMYYNITMNGYSVASGSSDIDGGNASDTFILVMAAEEEEEETGEPEEETEEPQEETGEESEDTADTTENPTENAGETTEETTEETAEETAESTEETAETETTETETTETETAETETTDAPETGDDGILMWGLLAAGALACMAVCRKRILKG